MQCLDEFGVSNHFMIGRDGKIFQMVDPQKRAWHAGQSKMPLESDGREGLNDFSIGIDFPATFSSGYTEEQLHAFFELIAFLKKTYPLINFYGHSDVAINRNGKAPYEDPENGVSPGEIPRIPKEEYVNLMVNEPKTDPWGFPWEAVTRQLRTFPDFQKFEISKGVGDGRRS